MPWRHPPRAYQGRTFPGGSTRTILDRGPFTVDGERALLAGQQIDTVVTKNSGGSATVAKLVAARELGLDVVMVSRPASPVVPTVGTVDDAVRWAQKIAPARRAPSWRL